MHAVKFYRRYWAAIGGLIFVALAFFVGLFGHQVPALQRFMVLMYMALIFHQFEEYIFPGGFPAAANIGLFGEKDNVDKYPLNEMSALLVNVFCAYPLYIVGIFRYEWLWYDIFGGKLHLPILLLVGAHLRLPRGGLLHHPAAHPQFQEEGYALRLCAVSGR